MRVALAFNDTLNPKDQASFDKIMRDRDAAVTDETLSDFHNYYYETEGMRKEGLSFKNMDAPAKVIEGNFGFPLETIMNSVGGVPMTKVDSSVTKPFKNLPYKTNASINLGGAKSILEILINPIVASSSVTKKIISWETYGVPMHRYEIFERALTQQWYTVDPNKNDLSSNILHHLPDRFYQENTRRQ